MLFLGVPCPQASSDADHASASETRTNPVCIILLQRSSLQARHSCLARKLALRHLQRTQEIEHFLLLRGGEAVEILDHSVSFAALAGMVLDGRDQVGGSAVVE